jgi:hypothetical protein
MHAGDHIRSWAAQKLGDRRLDLANVDLWQEEV